MKPLLIVAPAPARWPAIEDLLRHKGQPWLADIHHRLVNGLPPPPPGLPAPDAHDVFAVIPIGNQLLGNVTINRQGDLGVLGHCYVRPEHRGQGLARRMMQTALAWFDMTGGKWLFLGSTADLADGLYRKFGFEPLRRTPWQPQDRLMMVRRGPHVTGDPLAEVVSGPPAADTSGGTTALGAGIAPGPVTGEVMVRSVGRAEWPAMVTLLQYVPGLDPRVPLDESAVSAELFTLDLIEHQERGAYLLLGAQRGDRLVGLGMLATDRPGERTHAMLVPYADGPPELRNAILKLARARGYTHVDFPMEALAPAGGNVADPTVAAPVAPSAQPFDASTAPPAAPDAHPSN